MEEEERPADEEERPADEEERPVEEEERPTDEEERPGEATRRRDPSCFFFLGAGCQYYAFATVLFDGMVSCGIGD